MPKLTATVLLAVSLTAYPGKRPSLAASEGHTGGVTAQLATPEKSNPMYNTHPKL